jgi:hypothetical protein
MGDAKRRLEIITTNCQDPGRDEIVVVGVIEGVRVRTDPDTVKSVVPSHGSRLQPARCTLSWPRMTSRAVRCPRSIGAAARFIERLSPAPDFPEFKSVIVSTAITPHEGNEIVVVATVETIKRAWNDGGRNQRRAGLHRHQRRGRHPF